MDLLPGFLLGLFGSLHCAGMCGPLALALPATGHGAPQFILGRLAYNLGRLVTYGGLGLVCGVIGQSLFLLGLQRWLSLALGITLLAGLIVSRRVAFARPVAGVINHLKAGMSGLLRQPSLPALAMLGLCNGLLPCGLVYVACAGATATGGGLAGAAFMVAFGAGTLPMMLVLALSRHALPTGARLKMRKVTPVAVVLLAGLLILRGLALGIPYVSPRLAAGQAPACCHAAVPPAAAQGANHPDP